MRRDYFISVLFICFITGISCSTETTPDYTIRTSVSPPDAGSISPSSGEFKDGEQVAFEAQPNDEWLFVRWEGAATGTDNPVTISVNNDAMVRAVFEKKQYSLEISKKGEGEVTEKIVAAKDYDVNSTVEVEAIPAEGWSFLEWSGDLSGNENPKQVEMDSPKSIVANFEKQSFPLELIIVGDGTVVKSPEKEAYEYAESVELQAEPSEGWQFERWELDLTGSENPASVTINDSTEIQAVFSKVLFYLNVTNTKGGSVDINRISGEEQNGLYSRGAKVELSAHPDDGYKFDGWVGDASGNKNPIQVTIEDDMYIQANFSSNCSVVTNCMVTDFYASEIIGNRVQKGNISIKNILTESLTLNKITGKDEEGNLIGKEDDLGIKIRSGKTLSFSYNLHNKPFLRDFLQYKLEFFFEYKGKSYSVIQKAREKS